MKVLMLLAAVSFAAAGSQTSTPAKRYADNQHRVSFRYPGVWRALQPAEYLQSFVQANGAQPAAEFVFSPKGNLYEKTTLDGLGFLYFVLTASTEAECLKRSSMDGATSGPADRKTIHGLVYSHAAGGDAAMSHRLQADVYTTWWAGTCYVFEEDMWTIAPGVDEKRRDLTQRERSALKSHLDDVMQSVTIR